VDIELDRQFFELHDSKVYKNETFAPSLPKTQGYQIQNIDSTLALFLEEIINFYPILGEPSLDLGYSCARSIEVWSDWDIGKRKAVEWQRARRIKERIERDLKLSISTKVIVLWCRNTGHVPVFLKNPSMSQDKNQYCARYCKHCGCPHQPIEQFEQLEALCREKSRSLIREAVHMTTNHFSPKGELDMIDADVGNISNVVPTTDKFVEINTLTGELDWIHKLIVNIHPELDNSPQSKLIEAMILKAGFLFGKSLIRETYSIYAKQRKSDLLNEAKQKIIVPTHIFVAIQTRQFDFLLNNDTLQQIKEMYN